MRIPDSISAMVYTMRHRWLWTLAVWVVAFTALPFMLEASDSGQSVAFMSCGALALVGAMPLIAGEANTLHYVLASAAGVASQVWCIWVVGFFPLFAWWYVYCMTVSILGCMERERIWCLLAEIWCAASVVGVLIF